MIFYLCNGVQLAGTQADAKAIDPKFTQVDIPVDKAGLMAYVNNLLAQVWAKDDAYISHKEPLGPIHRSFADEDRPQELAPPVQTDLERINKLIDSCDRIIPRAPKVLPPVYATVSITIDDEWDKLPLPRKLHFAADALELARERVT
jgi:hypothetical protein